MSENNGTPENTSNTPAPTENGSWLDSLSDSQKALVEAKGWRSQGDALESYSQLESFVGADKAGRGLLLPKGDDDTEGYNAVYNALGRPEEPGGYEINALMGSRDVDAGYIDVMSQAMYEAGLSKKQAHSLAEKHQAVYENALKAAEESYAAAVDEVKRTLPAETIHAARAAFRAGGFSEDDARAMERALGPKRATELFAKLGAAYTEDKLVGDVKGDHNFSSLSASTAERRLNQLMSDPKWAKDYQNGELYAVKQMEDLAKRMTAG